MDNKIQNFLRVLGKPLVAFFMRLGSLTTFIGQSLYNCVTPPFYFKLVGRQFLDIGFYSLPVVGLTTVFAGMVIALQSYTGFARFGAESAVASVVWISVTRELAPVLSGLMVAGRIGAAMAAEIGTMRVTEQIDALVTLSILSNTWLRRGLSPALSFCRCWFSLVILSEFSAVMLSVFTNWASTRLTTSMRLFRIWKRWILFPAL